MSLDEAILRAAPERDSLDMRRAERTLEGILFGSDRPPLTLGRYVVLERIGSGGCGLVFAAYDPQLDRKVALKVLRLLSREADAQLHTQSLLREARAMASLSHPTIVPIHDVGSYAAADLGGGAGGLDVPPEGIFVVMELVVGQNLHEWSRSASRSRREILEAYLSAGRGLAAAHRAGIIHGDVKPSNIVIANDGRARVLDFGLAAWASQPRSDEHTTSGGTPGYLAPERLEGAPSSTLSDQFSFCVALSEALFDRGSSTRDTRVPRRVAVALDRGLSKDPRARFGSMEELLARITPRPRLHRFAVLGAGAMGAVAIAVLSLDEHCDEQADAAVRAVWNGESREAGRSAFLASERPFAGRAWAAVEADLERHAESWKELHIAACEAQPRVTARTVCLDRWLIRFEKVVSSMKRASKRLVELGPDATSKLSPGDLCGRTDPSVVVAEERRTEVLSVEDALASASALRTSGRLDEAREAIDVAFALAQQADDAITLARVLQGRAEYLDLIGDETQSEADYRGALYAAERAGDQEFALSAMIRLAAVRGTHGGQYEEALRLLEHAEARGIDELTLPRLAYDLAFTRGRVYEAMGRAGDSLRAYEDALAKLGADATPARRATLHNNMGVAHDRLGNKREALDQYLEALELHRISSGRLHPFYANAMGNVGITRSALGDEEQAVADLTESVEIYEKALGDDAASNQHIAWVIGNLGYVLLDSGRTREGLVQARRAHAIRLRALPAEHAHIGLSHRGLARALQASGRPREALPHAERAVEISRSHENSLRIVAAMTTKARVLCDLERFEDAVALAQKAAALADDQLGPDHHRSARAREQWGRALLRRGDAAAATPVLEQALVTLDRASVAGPGLVDVRFLLAQALRDSEPERALELARDARDAVAPIPHRAAETAELAAWTAELIGAVQR